MAKLTKLQIFNLVKPKKESQQNSNVIEANYYVDVFSTRQDDGIFDKWNWACFFSALFALDFIWFFYRKMYIRGLAALIISALIYTSIPLRILWALGLGLFGNYIYLDFLKKKYKVGFKTVGTNRSVSIMFFLGWLGLVAMELTRNLSEIIKLNPFS